MLAPSLIRSPKRYRLSQDFSTLATRRIPRILDFSGIETAMAGSSRPSCSWVFQINAATWAVNEFELFHLLQSSTNVLKPISKGVSLELPSVKLDKLTEFGRATDLQQSIENEK